MFPSTLLAAAGTAFFATQSLTYVIPEGSVNARGIVNSDRVRREIAPRQSASAAASATASASTSTGSSSGGSTLDLKITNSASGKMYAYIMGMDATSGKHVFYQEGASAWYYPSGSVTERESTNTAINTTSNKLAIEVDGNSDKTITLPQYLDSGRVYIGAQPMTFMMDTSENLVEPSPVDTSDANYDFAWGIVELAWLSTELAADLSYVDSVALALGLKVTTTDGQEYEDAGLPAGSLKKVCDELAAVSDDWGKMCVKGSSGDLIRALAPAKYVSANSAGSLSTFFDSYIDKVWEKFASTTLVSGSLHIPSRR